MYPGLTSSSHPFSNDDTYWQLQETGEAGWLLAHAQSSFQLGYIPLAVKTPYLNAWISSNTGSSPERAWPNFYTTDREFGWAGLIRVDNQPYQWMGNSGFNFTNTVSSYITPTKSVFTIQAGPMQFNVTFFSPIEPNDYVRQSMPFSYMYIDAFAANDSQPHSVQIYSDISGQWASRDDTTLVQWDTLQNDTLTYHLYYAMLNRQGLTSRSGQDAISRGAFATEGHLNNTKDTNFRAIGPQNWPVYCFAVDLGTVSPGTQPDPVVSAIGFARDPLVTYTTESAVQNRVSYYMSQYSTVEAAIAAFLSDFGAAQKRNADLDNKTMSAANGISSNYAGILALTARSIFSAMDITIPSPLSGAVDPSDVRIFMKDMGMTTRSNPVEVIYGALPALLYFNTSLVHNLLEPLLEFQSGSAYTNPYAAPDLGAAYPVILGNTTNTEALAVESTGSMLIMAYTYAVKSGDGSLISRYNSTLSKWADYLVANSLHPPLGSLTCDGLNTPNLSNLALKGILGIYSMAKINEALSVSNTTYMTDLEMIHWQEKANELFGQWQQLAVSNSSNRIQSVYGQAGSSGLIYNLFPAVWLNSSLVSDTLINNQAQFYAQQSSQEYILDSSLPDTVFPHWTLLTAATIPSGLSAIRDRLINSEYQYMYNVTNKFPMPINYRASDKSRISGSNSAIWGAAFGILALNLPNVPIQSDALPNTTPSKRNVGAIVGGVIGGLAGLLAILVGIFFWRRHQHKHDPQNVLDAEDSKPRPFNSSSTSMNGNNSGIIVTDGAQLSNTNATISPSQHWSPDWEGMSQNPRFFSGATGSGSDVADSNTSSSLPPGAAPPPAISLSSKHREALGLNRIPGTYHVAAPSESAVSTLSNPYSTSASGAEDLRAEVEQLRREMESIRHMAEPPPVYH
ncbi:hypothetical protein D9756_010802 [Leucocoprinus leucothites]|uniref:DUF1793-domain-containing protein n=1 Tax=Leucocoprinus leucothites TaxID=201217 RepID=A0A8H5FQP1_9AGAR|nr:hypothetical protein D9756_010802 [Leucoagaricus leucothites]